MTEGQGQTPSERRQALLKGGARWLALLLLLCVLFLSCGWLSLVGTQQAASADTRSLLKAIYLPWQFLPFHPVEPGILDDIATETGKEPVALDLSVGGTIVGWYWWTPVASASVTPTPPPATSTSAPDARRILAISIEKQSKFFSSNSGNCSSTISPPSTMVVKYSLKAFAASCPYA